MAWVIGTTVQIRIPISFISHHLLHGKDGEDGKDVEATSKNLGGCSFFIWRWSFSNSTRHCCLLSSWWHCCFIVGGVVSHFQLLRSNCLLSFRLLHEENSASLICYLLLHTCKWYVLRDEYSCTFIIICNFLLVQNFYLFCWSIWTYFLLCMPYLTFYLSSSLTVWLNVVLIFRVLLFQYVWWVNCRVFIAQVFIVWAVMLHVFLCVRVW